MGRLDFESGRFTTDFETNEIHRALKGWQSEFGDSVLWWRFWMEQSEEDDIWDEAAGLGRVWHPPAEVKALHVTHVEGGNQDRTQGQYYNDNFYMTCSWEQLQRAGFTEFDLQYHSYLSDRIIYDYRVFRVTRIQVMGQIQRRDTVVSVEGTQVKPDEMLNDSQFAKFANVRFPENP